MFCTFAVCFSLNYLLTAFICFSLLFLCFSPEAKIQQHFTLQKYNTFLRNYKLFDERIKIVDERIKIFDERKNGGGFLGFLGVWGLRFGVQSLKFEVWGLRFRVQFKIQHLGFKVGGRMRKHQIPATRRVEPCWDEVAPRPRYPGRLNLPSYS